MPEEICAKLFHLILKGRNMHDANYAEGDKSQVSIYENRSIRERLYALSSFVSQLKSLKTNYEKEVL